MTLALLAFMRRPGCSRETSGFSTAYIGSSNLTHTALHEGLEWNVRLSEASSARPAGKVPRQCFATYWEDPRFEAYEKDAFDAAIARENHDSDDRPASLRTRSPTRSQREMLYRLEVERTVHNRWKNLIVAATGSGKTVVSAFDYKQVAARVARRFPPLRRAPPGDPETKSCHLPECPPTMPNFGELMVAGEQPRGGKHVFASIQSLHQHDPGRPWRQISTTS